MNNWILVLNMWYFAWKSILWLYFYKSVITCEGPRKVCRLLHSIKSSGIMSDWTLVCPISALFCFLLSRTQKHVKNWVFAKMNFIWPRLKDFNWQVFWDIPTFSSMKLLPLITCYFHFSKFQCFNRFAVFWGFGHFFYRSDHCGIPGVSTRPRLAA